MVGMEQRKFIVKLGFMNRKDWKWDICKEGLNHKIQSRLHDNFKEYWSAHGAFCKSYVTITGVEPEVVDLWVAMVKRAGIKIKEVEEFF